MSRDRLKSWLLDGAAAWVLLALPLVNYLHHNAYPWPTPEVGILAALLTAAALVLGAVMSLGRRPGRVAVITMLIVLVCDVQTGWFATVLWPAAAVGAITAAVGWLLHGRLSLIVATVGGVMILSTLLLPPGEPLRIHRDDLEGGDPSLPLIVHLVLDEHIGVEGIPDQFDPDREIADRIGDFYLDRGFDVYGRAYSRYYNTEDSISNLLNFSASDVPKHFFGGHFEEGMVLQQNEWFDDLRAQGYSLQVVQSEYLRYLPVDGDGAGPGGSCYSYTSESISSLSSAPLGPAQRVQFIIGTYCKLSRFLEYAGRSYPALKSSFLGHALDLPDLGRPGRTRISPLASRDALDYLTRRMATAGRGEAYFAHLLLPHYPYAYRADCSLRSSAGQWLEARDIRCYPYRNDDESRALRYPRYLDQVVCLTDRLGELFEALESRGLWDDAVIIVHGDHGSRLDRGPPKPPQIEALAARDFVDAFSTLFVVKRGSTRGTYHEDLAPIDELFELVVPGRRVRRQIDPSEPPRFLMRDGDNRMPWRPLPVFGDGKVR